MASLKTLAEDDSYTAKYQHVAAHSYNQSDPAYSKAADAGIAASVLQTGSSLGVNVQVKAAKESQYRIAVWVLEDGIRAKQDGAFEDWMNTHSNAVRAMAGTTLNLRIYGESLDILKKGETAEKSFVIDIEDGWDVENCKVMVLVNAATDEEIRAILLDDEYLGTYTFLAEGLTEVQLEWGCDYKLFAIPFDANENAGEMFVMDIPALDRSGAAPVEEY